MQQGATPEELGNPFNLTLLVSQGNMGKGGQAAKKYQALLYNLSHKFQVTSDTEAVTVAGTASSLTLLALLLLFCTISSSNRCKGTKNKVTLLSFIPLYCFVSLTRDNT